MSGIRIMIAEDDANLNKLITRYLEKEGYLVFSADNGDDALDLWFDQSIDLSILDVMMPGLDGWGLLEEIRKESDNPVIMLTARRDEEDRVRGFELGTDDYITKPFSSRELLMRVKALLRRSGKLSQRDTVELPGITLDNKAKSIRTASGEVDLSAREYELMVYFIDNRGSALTRMQILDRIWGYEYTGDTRVLDTTVKRLRHKLGDCGKCIKTIRGTGYKFEVAE